MLDEELRDALILNTDGLKHTFKVFTEELFDLGVSHRLMLLQLVLEVLGLGLEGLPPLLCIIFVAFDRLDLLLLRCDLRVVHLRRQLDVLKLQLPEDRIDLGAEALPFAAFQVVQVGTEVEVELLDLRCLLAPLLCECVENGLVGADELSKLRLLQLVDGLEAVAKQA